MIHRSIALLVIFATVAALLGPSGTPRAATSSLSASAPAASATISPKPGFVDNTTITTYLSEVITWYRHQATEAQLVDHPEEVLFFATDQQIAKEVLDLAFDAARAQVALNAKSKPSAREESAANESPIIRNLAGRMSDAQAKLAEAQRRVKDLQAQLDAAPRNQRATISAQISSAQGEAGLQQGRVDAIKSMLQYANGLTTADQNASGITAQIDQLQQAVSTTPGKSKTTAALADAATQKLEQESHGILGLFAVYFELSGDSKMLRDSARGIDNFIAKIDQFRRPAGHLLGEIGKRGAELSKTESSDAAEISNHTAEYKRLVELHDAAFGVVAPLDKQEVQLSLYKENLQRWQSSVDRYSSRVMRDLAVRLVTLFGLLALVIAGKALSRRLIDRFVAEPQRRRQLQQVSDPVSWALIAFVIIINFATELGSIATIMGFAAAGIALALQNVILSVAGYFFLIGKFGIRVGDRVQIGNTVGDVISIGLVKLTLMELSLQDKQPTGRVVVYSNAVVFQPNGNFFKQAPGMGFVWNEIKLTLAPDCDYRLAEKRVVDAIEEVFSRYRERVQRDFRYLEADLHVLLESPRPQSRLQLTSAGLDMIVRYPADVRTAVQIADEVSRRVLDAIKREPGLTLVSPGTANIQPITPPAEAEEDHPGEEEPIAANGGQQAIAKR